MDDDPFVKLSFTPDNGLSFTLDTMEASESLGRPFTIILDVSSDKPKGDLHALLGSSATVSLNYPNKDTRYFNGLVGRVQYRGLIGGGYKYRLELRPWIWLLSQQQDCRIFSNKSPWEIMTGLFREAGFPDFSDKRQNGSGDTVLDYCVQYRETTLDFATRLMEQYGLYYYVIHKDGTHTIVFADDPNSHSSAGAAIPYRYDETNWRAADDHVWDWTADAQIQPGAYALREYNFTTPRADLTAKSLISGQHTHGTQEVYDYPGRYEVVADGQKLARVRMQDLDTRRQVFGGTSNSRKLGAGEKFTLSHFPDTAANQEYLVVESLCSVQRAETRSFQNDDEIIDTFRCVLRAVPGSRPFRLPDITPRPQIRGPQTARVAGEAGQEITTDQYGRIKVKFPWDRSPGADENSSCWIRVAQTWSGQAWGTMFIPRIGQEVVVEFLEGNPDRPLVTGSVYNADMTVPYALPANKTRSTMKSNSSLQGGGFNEFRFEDKKGEEEVFFHAQKDFNEIILGAHTETITGNTTTLIDQGNRSYTVKTGTDLLKVQGDRTVTLNSNDSLTVAIDRKEEIGANHSLLVKADRSTTVNGNRQEQVKGTDTLKVTGHRDETFEAGQTQAIDSGQTVTVRSGNHQLKVSGGSSLIDGATKITLVSGASSIEISPSGIKISAPKITISAEAKLEMSAAQASLEGTAKVEISGAMASVDGSAKLDLSGGALASLSAALVKIN